MDWGLLSDYQHIFTIIAYIIGGFLLHWLIKRILLMAGKHNPTVLHWVFLGNTSKILIMVLVIYAILASIPQLQSVSTVLLTGSSIVAAAVALASQKSLGNAVNGVIISLAHPFAVGDRIRLINQGVTGFVESVNLTHTIIRTIENNRLLIPNVTVLDDVIENLNYADSRICNFLDVGITFDSDIGLAQTIMADVVTSHPLWIDTRTDEDISNNVPLVRVLVREIANHRVELRVGVWSRSIMDSFLLCSEARKEIVDRFINQGVVLYRPFLDGIKE